MNRGVLIAGLFGLNLALAIILAVTWKVRGNASPAPTPSLRQIPAGAVPPAPVAEAASPLDPASAPAKLDWHALESPDFSQFIGNLRAVACPEQTIQDVIIARVNARFVAREAELKLRPEHLKPWEAGAWSEPAQRERERKLRELIREKRAQLKELLGIDVPGEIPPAYARRGADRFEAAYAGLPLARRDTVRQIQESFWDQVDDLEARTRGFWEPEDREESKRLRDERNRALAAVLTDDEREGFEMATSVTAATLRSELAAFNATDTEFREIFHLRARLDDQFNAGQGTELPDDATARGQYEQQLKSLLGEARYGDYQRAQDPRYRNLARIAEETGLSREATIKAYEAQQAGRAETARLRTDSALGTAQRQAALKAMQAEIDKTMLQLLGERGFQSWRRSDSGRMSLKPRLPALPVTRPPP